MAMSRKHYHEVADIILSEREAAKLLPPDMKSAVDVSTFIMAGKLATMFAVDNSNFDRQTFYRACGFDE